MINKYFYKLLVYETHQMMINIDVKRNKTKLMTGAVRSLCSQEKIWGGGRVHYSPVSLANVCALITVRTSPPNGMEKALQPAVGRHVSAVFLSGENSAVTHRVSSAAAPSALPPNKGSPPQLGPFLLSFLLPPFFFSLYSDNFQQL